MKLPFLYESFIKYLMYFNVKKMLLLGTTLVIETLNPV